MTFIGRNSPLPLLSIYYQRYRFGWPFYSSVSSLLCSSSKLLCTSQMLKLSVCKITTWSIFDLLKGEEWKTWLLKNFVETTNGFIASHFEHVCESQRNIIKESSHYKSRSRVFADSRRQKQLMGFQELLI